jgi:quercetin 2,3-dioxygenase
MQMIVHTAGSRGYADHGWLKSHHTFSFAGYFDPQRVRFGTIRVLNDDTVEGGMGFGSHPHDNMEIISIPLEGDLEHRDSMGNTAVIKKGDVQVMSAGSGITHSEFNHSKEKPVKFLQIWVFPDKKNVTPRYDQVTLKETDRQNRLQNIISPTNRNANGLWINQEAWFYIGKFDREQEVVYKLNKSSNGIYLFVLSGEITVNEQTLAARDGCGITDAGDLKLKVKTGCEILLMEVPMQ